MFLSAEVFPDRDHFGRIFYNQANMSAQGIPQVYSMHKNNEFAPAEELFVYPVFVLFERFIETTCWVDIILLDSANN